MLKPTNKHLFTLVLVALVGFLNSGYSNSSCQSVSEGEMILNRFLDALFNESIPPEHVVDKYVYAGKYLDSDGNILDGRNLAIQYIKLIRGEVENDNGYVLPNYKIADKKNRTIGKYSDYKGMSTFKFEGLTEKEKDWIYVVLNQDNAKVENYFLIKENKVHSFCSLAKGEHYLNFLIYNEEP